MGWKQRSMLLSEWRSFQDRFAAAMVAKGAPSTWALFLQNAPGSERSILLLSPDAAKELGHDWDDAADPTQSKWCLLIGEGDPFKRFGLKPDVAYDD